MRVCFETLSAKRTPTHGNLRRADHAAAAAAVGAGAYDGGGGRDAAGGPTTRFNFKQECFVTARAMQDTLGSIVLDSSTWRALCDLMQVRSCAMLLVCLLRITSASCARLRRVICRWP